MAIKTEVIDWRAYDWSTFDEGNGDVLSVDFNNQGNDNEPPGYRTTVMKGFHLNPGACTHIQIRGIPQRLYRAIVKDAHSNDS